MFLYHTFNNPPVPHGVETFFVYGVPPDNTTSAILLSNIMIDYWISFITSLDPNDGHGTPRMLFHP
jgi:acetylcholinesterase